jgi:hypothetical protein
MADRPIHCTEAEFNADPPEGAPIRVTSEIVPNSRGQYRAETVIDGKTYVGISRNGATCELSRVLVAAGIADAPMHLYSGGKLALMIRSFHRHAGRSYAR